MKFIIPSPHPHKKKRGKAYSFAFSMDFEVTRPVAHLDIRVAPKTRLDSYLKGQGHPSE